MSYQDFVKGFRRITMVAILLIDLLGENRAPCEQGNQLGSCRSDPRKGSGDGVFGQHDPEEIREIESRATGFAK